MNNIVFTAYSKKNFYNKNFISAFVLENDMIPINPFLNYDYFLSDLVDRDKVRSANNALINVSDELWVFGDIADGVYSEINLAIEKNMKMRFFKLGSSVSDIKEVSIDDLNFESEIKEDLVKFKEKVNKYIEEWEK